MDWLLVLFAAALILMLACVMALRGRRPGASRSHGPAEANAASAAPAPPTTPALPADDAAEVLEYLRRLEAQGSPGLAADVIEIFLHDTSSRLTALRQAIAQGDGETVFRVAHTMQGSASMIGAASMARSCSDLAKSARGGSFDQCNVLVSELDARFRAIQRALPVSRLTGPEPRR
jgi:HPt (histidine-containing phosphotransfer) domain-containing protein